jgi:hypothetical protein
MAACCCSAVALTALMTSSLKQLHAQAAALEERRSVLLAELGKQKR